MDKVDIHDKHCPVINLPIIKQNNGKLQKYKAYFNGFIILIKDEEVIRNIQERGSFGKGTLCRNKVYFHKMEILRKRQLQYRNNLVKFTKANELKPRTVLVAPDSSDEDETEEDRYFNNIKVEYDINKVQVLSLQLLHEEAFYLMQMNCVELIDTNNVCMSLENVWTKFNELNDLFTENYVVYHYYRSKNWVVKSGLLFGGDFLLYRDGPNNCHSCYIVIIGIINGNKPSRRKMDICTLTGLNRVAENARKELLIAYVIYPNMHEINLNEYTCIKSFKIKEALFKRRK